MDQPVADVLVVFGGGLQKSLGGYELSPLSMARVQTAANHVARAGAKPLIIFTGGWAEAARGDPEPPPGNREADLMLRHAQALDLDARATLIAESTSRSTLENLLHIAGLLDGQHFDAAHPLGLVSHAWHLPRARFLAGKVLGLRGPALLDIPVTTGALAPAGISPRLRHLAARLGYLRARRPAPRLRRERRIVAVARKVERFRRRRGDARA